LEAFWVYLKLLKWVQKTLRIELFFSMDLVKNNHNKNWHGGSPPKLLIVLHRHNGCLTPKGPRPFFDPFLKFGQVIVDAIFVQKISNFRWTCGLVRASRRTNFYEIPISNLGAMLQKQKYFEVQAARAAKKLFI
jgi:hypothetical protein